MSASNDKHDSKREKKNLRILSMKVDAKRLPIIPFCNSKFSSRYFDYYYPLIFINHYRTKRLSHLQQCVADGCVLCHFCWSLRSTNGILEIVCSQYLITNIIIIIYW